jgi:hypothetical protein
MFYSLKKAWPKTGRKRCIHYGGQLLAAHSKMAANTAPKAM